MGRGDGDPMQLRVIAHAQVRRESERCGGLVSEILSSAPQDCYLPPPEPPRNTEEEEDLIRCLETAVWNSLRACEDIRARYSPTSRPQPRAPESPVQLLPAGAPETGTTVRARKSIAGSAAPEDMPTSTDEASLDDHPLRSGGSSAEMRGVPSAPPVGAGHSVDTSDDFVDVEEGEEYGDDDEDVVQLDTMFGKSSARLADAPKDHFAKMSMASITPIESKQVPKPGGKPADFQGVSSIPPLPLDALQSGRRSFASKRATPLDKSLGGFGESAVSIITLNMPQPPAPLPPTWCTTPLTAANLEKNSTMIGQAPPAFPSIADLPQTDEAAREALVFPPMEEGDFEKREMMRDDDGEALNIVRVIEDVGGEEGRVVSFWNGNPNLQLVVELINAEPHPDTQMVFDEMLKKEVITLTVFPGEKRGACVNWKKGKFPKVKWRLETLGLDYLEWRKSEREQQVFDHLVGLENIAPQEAPEDEVFCKALETKKPFVDAAFFPGDDSLLACMTFSAFETAFEKRLKGLPPDQRPDAEALGTNMAVISSSGWARNYVAPPPDAPEGEDPAPIPRKSLFTPEGVSGAEVRLVPHALGCRWLLCAFAVLAEYRRASQDESNAEEQNGVLLRAAFSLTNDAMLQNGGCKVLLCKDGWWGVSVVDDYLPMDHNVPAFATSAAGAHILWASLLEKAIAKSCGSYLSLHGSGSVDEALCDITGFPVKSYSGEAWGDHREYLSELIAVWRAEFDYIVVLVSPPESDETQERLADHSLTPGCGYTVKSVTEDFGAVCIADPYSTPGKVVERAIPWEDAANLFAGLSVCYVEPLSREIRVVLPVHPNGQMFAFGLHIELNEDAPKVRALIHAHQEDGRRHGEFDVMYGVMMVTVLGYMGDGEWVKVGSVAEWGPRDMLAAQDDEDPDPGVVLDPEYHKQYFIAFHMHPQCLVKGDLVAAMHYSPVGSGETVPGTEFGTMTFKENDGWDYATGNVATSFDPLNIRDVEATVQRRESYFHPIEAGILATLPL
eukprot:TRINITY_DN18048_c2_g1_i1.p1 TRINITY_DN18048_c2_g1~~TRINITY_DN18048_c2_g1_i1.p1  ORF type:complete len:1084 (+),score=374.24 TRINITY_DN18048_c2_g1_i1:215-3253(+)